MLKPTATTKKRFSAPYGRPLCTAVCTLATMTLMSASAFSMSNATPHFSPVFAQFGSMEELQKLLEEAAKKQAEMGNLPQQQNSGASAATEKKEAAPSKEDLKAAKDAFESLIFTRDLDEDEIEEYVKKGGDINDDFKIGMNKTKLILAVSDLDNKFTFPNPDELIEALVKNGANINIKNKNEQNALTLALSKTGGFGFGAGDDLERLSNIIEALIDNGISIDDKDKKGNNALLYAAQSARCDDLLKLLVEKGADVNVADKDGASVLMIAAKNQKKEIVEFLIEKGADVEAKDSKGKTVVDYASAGVKPLFAKAEEKKPEPKQEKKKAPTTIDKNATAELTRAIKDGNQDNIEQLIEKGADINAVNADGVPLLVAALQDKQFKTAKLLAEYGAKPNVSNKYEVTALALALDKYQDDIAKILIENGADVKVNSPNGVPLPVVALIHSQYDMVKLLVEKGANVNAVDVNGSSLLMQAADHNCKMEFLDFLIDHGADLTLKDKNGKTISDHGRSNDQPGVKEFIAKVKEDEKKKEEEKEAKLNQATKTLRTLIERNDLKPDMLEKLIEKGADVNVEITKNGVKTYPILIYADMSAIEDYAITPPGNKWSSPEYNGKTLTVYKAKSEKDALDYEIFWKLINAKADLTVRNSKDASLLDIILLTFNTDGYAVVGHDNAKEKLEHWLLMLNILKEKGVDFSDPESPAIPLFLAKGRKLGPWSGDKFTKAQVKLGIVKFLKEAGADIKARVNSKKATILMLVIQQEQDRDTKELIEGLIELGADVLGEDVNGKALPDYVPNSPNDTINYKIGEWLKQVYYDKLLED